MRQSGVGFARRSSRIAALALGVLCAGQAGPEAQGRGGQAGPAQPQAPRSARAVAPVDLTGTWVSVVTEDWPWRMFTPRKGDFASVPLNAEGRRVANLWTEDQDGSCRAYGVGNVMKNPGRIRISWDDDNTLRIETDAGRQTRLLHFYVARPPAGPRTLQGFSVANWEMPGQAVGTGAGGAAVNAALQAPRPSWASLKVVTTNFQAAWLRKNGVPYSENASITEYFDVYREPEGEWLTVTTIVEDPVYLNQPFITSPNFRKEPDASKWNPVPCRM